MARRHYDIDLEKIDLKSWQSLVDNNEEILVLLDSVASNAGDIIANSSSLVVMTEAMNTALRDLRKVSMESLDEPNALVACSNKIQEFFEESAVVIVASCKYAEQAVKGIIEDQDDGITEFFKMILKGADDNSLYWIVYEFSKQHGFKALGFVMAYGNDAKNDGGDFIFGDGAKALFGEELIKGAENFDKNKIIVWKNAAVGTIAVVSFTLVKDLINHEGDWTQDDAFRIGLDIFAAGLGYMEWTAIAGLFEAAGLAIPGVAVAAIVGMGTAMLFDSFIDVMTGDNIIHSFEYNGVPYEVPKNGTGGETFDVLLDRYRKSKREYNIGDRKVSEHEFKDRMYEDLENFYKEYSGKEMEKDKIDSPFYGMDYFEEALDELAKADSYEKGLDAFYEHLGNKSIYADIILGVLIPEFDFDLEEYYYYKKEERGDK